MQYQRNLLPAVPHSYSLLKIALKKIDRNIHVLLISSHPFNAKIVNFFIIFFFFFFFFKNIYLNKKEQRCFMTKTRCSNLRFAVGVERRNNIRSQGNTGLIPSPIH